MRFCKLKPRDAQASASAAASAPAWMPPDNPADMWANMLGPAPKRRKQIDERRGPFHNIERMAAAAAAAEQRGWQGPCQWGRLQKPVQEADGRMRHCKLRPMPSGWKDLIPKR